MLWPFQGIERMRDEGSKDTSTSGAERASSAPASGMAGGQIGAELATREAAATDVFRTAMALFAEEAKKNTPADKLKGNLFEYIEAAKFNRNAARAGKSVRANVTAAEGSPKGPVDIALRDAGRTTRKIQAKVSNKPGRLASQATKKKYDGMDVVVQKDKVAATNKRLAERGKGRKVIGELRSAGVGSGGTSTEELRQATNNPKLYRIAVEARQVGREALVTGAHAAVGGAVVGGALSAISNTASYLSGKIDSRTAIGNVATDTAKSGARAGGAGAAGALIRQAGGRAGLRSLAKSNVASAVAAAVIEVGVTVHDLAKGEVTTEEAAERIGETGCATASGIYVGAAVGAIFGPPGAIVGSLVGYMAMSCVYQSCIAVLRGGRLAEEEAAKVISLCAEAVQAMEQQRKDFETRLGEFLNERERAFGDCFELIDDALGRNEPDDAVTGLALLTGLTGKALKFKDFDAFDEFMRTSSDPLVI